MTVPESSLPSSPLNVMAILSRETTKVGWDLGPIGVGLPHRRRCLMVWLVLIGGIQILGFGLTLTRLAYDEWQQWRLSRTAPAAKEGRQSRVEYESWRTATT